MKDRLSSTSKNSKTLAVHSYKGGTGKTSISANLAAIYAMKGFNVCLLDYDFRAPSLHVLFNLKPENWLNNFLDGECSIEDALIDLTDRYSTSGRFRVALADPSIKAIRHMMLKGREWEMKSLHKLLTTKTTLHEKLKIDYIIFDTSPGIHYSSINALVTSDLVILVMKMDEYDIQGTQELIRGIYDVLGKKTCLLVNQMVGGEQDYGEVVTGRFKKMFHLHQLGVVQFYEEALLTGGREIFALERPEHPFTKSLLKISEDIERMFTNHTGENSA